LTPILSRKNSFLLSSKNKCDSLLDSWKTSFHDSKKKEQLFLDFEDNKEQVIKPTYTKEGLWLPLIGILNCARFIYMMLGHAPIGEYCQRFFPNSSYQCPCSEANIEIQEHIFMQCKLYDSSCCPRDINIMSFLKFIVGNPTSFCFGNG